MVRSLFQIFQQIRLEQKLSSSSSWSMGSITVFFNAMGIQVSRYFKIRLAKVLHCPLKSVPRSHIKVRKLLKGFTKLPMVGSGQSNSDSLLILGFILIQQQLVSCHGLFNTPSSPSTGTSFVRMARHHTSGCSTRLIQVLWFMLGKESWLMFKPSPPPPKASFESSASEPTHCGWGNVSSLECTSWLTKADSQNPNSRRFVQRTATQPLTNGKSTQRESA